MPAAVNEREVAEQLLDAGPPPPDLLADKGFAGKAFAAAQAARGTAVLVPPAKGQRASMPTILQKVGCPSFPDGGSNRIFAGKDGIECQERTAVTSLQSSRRKPPGWW